MPKVLQYINIIVNQSIMTKYSIVILTSVFVYVAYVVSKIKVGFAVFFVENYQISD